MPSGDRKRNIDAISYAKVVFDIGKNAKETVTAELDYQFYDADGQIVDASNVHTETGQIQAALPVYVTKELKLKVDFKEAPGARLADMTCSHQAGERCGFRRCVRPEQYGFHCAGQL